MSRTKVKMYKIAVANGKMTIDEVPEEYREEVKALLESEK